MNFKDGFRAAMDKAGGDIVGRRGVFDQCPIATYLTGITGLQCYVNGAEISWSASDDCFTPDWVREFIGRIDVEGHVGSEVTGSECVHVLDELEASA